MLIHLWLLAAAAATSPLIPKIASTPPAGDNPGVPPPVTLSAAPAEPPLDGDHPPASATPEGTSSGEHDAALASKVDELGSRLERLELALPDEDLSPYQPEAPPVSPNVLNPSITAVGDLLFRYDDPSPQGVAGRNDNALMLRELELDFRAAVDPYAQGVAVFSLGQTSSGSFEPDVEEAYVTIGRLPLPVLDAPPLGIQLTLGRFRTDVGLVNRLHLHDLPWVTRPLVLEELFGEEGYRGTGASLRLLLPWFSDDGALELTGQVLAGGGIPVGETEARFPSVVGNLRLVQLVAQAHELDLAGVFLFTRTDPEGNLHDLSYGPDFLYKWRPRKDADTSSFLLGGQAFFSEREYLAEAPHPGEALRKAENAPFGYFAYAQAQLTRRAYLGARWDDAGALTDASQHGRALSGYLTWYASEFLRFRFGYEHGFSEFGLGDRNTAFAQLDFVFGSHPPEPYWVNP